MGTRFADVRWVEETGSTNADLLDLARDGAPEGVVLVADHQTAGRGRHGRTWTAPPGSSLLTSLLLRPPSAVADACAMALGAAAVAALAEVLGVAPRLKWPNDVVWPGDGSVPERKLAGILAEADWPAGSTVAAGWRAPSPPERVVVVAGVGVNVNWPADLPDDPGELAVACNHVAGRSIDREDLLVALLRQFDARYAALRETSDRSPVLEEWRARSATLGRRVRVHVAAGEHEGTAVAVTDEGHLVVEATDGARRTFAAGDVVHLRPA